MLFLVGTGKKPAGKKPTGKKPTGKKPTGKALGASKPAKPQKSDSGVKAGMFAFNFLFVLTLFLNFCV